MLSCACANVQTHQSIRWSHIWQRKRISGQQESLVLIRLSTDKRLRWTCAALWIFTRALTRCSHKWHTHRRSSMHMGFWYCYEGSSEPVQMCRLTRTFASGHRFPFEPPHDILELWWIIRWACSLEHFLLAKMTPKSPFERARDFDTYRIGKWLRLWRVCIFALTVSSEPSQQY